LNGRALLVSPLGFLIGVSLGALGGGGSILAVPILVYAAGESPQAATTTSLVIVGAASLVGMVAHLRAGRVRVLPGVLFGLAGVGSIVGLTTGFFGVGGGFIVVPALVLALRFDMAEAVGTSLLVIAINSAVAIAGRVGNAGVDWAFAAPFTIAALLGVSVGKRVADRLPIVTLVRWFVGLLLVLAVYVAIRAGLALQSA